jgi:hypothetical protein
MTNPPKKPIPVTCFTGFLGAVRPRPRVPLPPNLILIPPLQGKTSTILGLLGQLPPDYRVVLLKNEYGDVEGQSRRE